MTTPLLDSNGKLNGESVRYVAIGDSFTEGVGDVDPRRPNGVRGWADRVAAAIGSVDPEATYANLAIRGRLLNPIIDEQLPVALDLCPNVVTFYGGGNDIMRPNVNIDQLMTRVDEAFAALRAQDITILTITGLNVQGQGPFAGTRGRTAIYNELLRGIAEDHGAHIIDYWRWNDFIDWRLWADDRLHMNELGHERFASRALVQLGLPGIVPERALPPEVQLTVREKVEQEARWVREFALPWVGRRLKGTSSGDNLLPKYPTLVPAARV